MDGNGRWAQARALPRPAGHQAGMQAVREAVEGARAAGVQVLTLFAFSQENWQRPPEEIDALMALLEEYIARERQELVAQGRRGPVPRRPRPAGAERARGGGRHDGRPPRAAPSWRSTSASRTAPAPSWRARRGCIAEDVAAGRLVPAEVDEAAVARRLYTAPWPDPDLLIRTSGELRLSNFLLWQLAYAELYVTPVLWPDFTRQRLLRGRRSSSSGRERRFGRVSDLMDRNMQTRIAFAVVAIPAAIGIVWLGGWALVALLAAAGVLGTRELFAFARGAGRARRPAPSGSAPPPSPPRSPSLALSRDGSRRPPRRLVALRRRPLGARRAHLGAGAVAARTRTARRGRGHAARRRCTRRPSPPSCWSCATPRSGRAPGRAPRWCSFRWW